MPSHITLPANVQPEVRDAFQQVQEQLRKMEVPILKDMREVRGIPEGSSCYFVTVRTPGVRKFTKVNNALYYEDLEKL